jgi:hypothetical protein
MKGDDGNRAYYYPGIAVNPGPCNAPFMFVALTT